jgi:hypothetical protein
VSFSGRKHSAALGTGWVAPLVLHDLRLPDLRQAEGGRPGTRVVRAVLAESNRVGCLWVHFASNLKLFVDADLLYDSVTNVVGAD